MAMELVYQCFRLARCRRRENGELVAEAGFLDRQMEKKARIYLDTKDLLIKRAEVVTIREAGQPVPEPQLDYPSLQGVKAYFGSGKALRTAVPDRQDIALFSEAITAVIQAEAAFFTERGFATAEIYDDFWDDIYSGSCNYYSNMDRIQNRFMQYISGQTRDEDYFTRFLSTSVFQLGDDTWRLNVSLSDIYHEMGLELQVQGPEGRIDNAQTWMLRVPDAVCREPRQLMPKLVGEPLAAATRIVGGGNGCVHLRHMVAEATTAWGQA